MDAVAQQWEAITVEEKHYLALVGAAKVLLRVHPIPFDTATEAVRAADRLNRAKHGFKA